ncbi:MAG: type VI secretion system contractile sheath large subunit [Puniceicoccales bacterium]|jgi:type VI secretion system ImpB/VipA family protein|nr:type VI secretion system contractile sheath large subunit [Puniceicoccales bacterium]
MQDDKNDELDFDALLSQLNDDGDEKNPENKDETSSDGDSDLDALLSGLNDDDDKVEPETAPAESESNSDLDSLLSSFEDDTTEDTSSSSDDSTPPDFSDSSDDDDDDTSAPAAPPQKAAPVAPKEKLNTTIKPTLSATIGVRTAPKANPNSKQPLVIALLGDFSGRASRGLTEPLAGREGNNVDIDSLEDLYEKFSPSLSLEDPGSPGTFVELEFSELDDFGPDVLIKKIPSLRDLRTLRPMLLNASTAARAAKSLENLLGTPLPPPPPRSTAARVGETPEQTLERLLGNAPATKTATGTAGIVASLIRQAVAGNMTLNPTTHQKELLALLDKAVSERLRLLLANPRFQALEAAWRSLDRLARSFDDGDNIRLLAYDISKEELAADFIPPPPADADRETSLDAEITLADALAESAEITAETTGLHKMLRDTIAEQPWFAAFALHTFGDSPADLALTGRIASVFALNKTPLVAAGHSFALGCPSFVTHPDPDNWAKIAKTELGAALKELRDSPAAAYLALALPRVMSRLPYGRNSEPIDTFPFEEIENTAQYEQYLWGNPAALIAQLYIERFKREGWKMDITAGQTIGDLPVYTFKNGKDSVMIPCAETWLSERAGVAIINSGYIPVFSIKNSNSSRIGRINSIAADNTPLELRVPV